MGAVFKNKSFLFALLFWAGCFLASCYLYYAASIVNTQLVVSDERLSVDLDMSIKNLINQQIGKSPSFIFEELKLRYPMVSQLNVKRINIAQNYVKFAAQDLLYQLGPNFVLTKQDQVFLTSCFSEAALRGLPIIHLHSVVETANDIELGQKIFLKNLPEFVIQQYDVHWYGLNHIVLINKENAKQQIILRHDQNITKELILTCHKLMAVHQLHANKKCLGIVKIDVRFEQQIIIAC